MRLQLVDVADDHVRDGEPDGRDRRHQKRRREVEPAERLGHPEQHDDRQQVERRSERAPDELDDERGPIRRLEPDPVPEASSDTAAILLRRPPPDEGLATLRHQPALAPTLHRRRGCENHNDPYELYADVRRSLAPSIRIRPRYRAAPAATMGTVSPTTASRRRPSAGNAAESTRPPSIVANSDQAICGPRPSSSQ